MIITCEHCHAKYNIPEEAIGPRGRSVKCIKCEKTWYEKPIHTSTPPESNIKIRTEQTTIKNLPAISKSNLNVKLKIAMSTLLILNLFTSLFFFKKFWISSIPATHYIYKFFGSTDTHDLILRNMAIRKIENGNINNFYIRGEIYNLGHKTIKLPEIRVQIFDHNHNNIYNNIIDLSEDSSKTIQSNEVYLIDRSLGNVDTNASIVRIDLGDSLDLMMR